MHRVHARRSPDGVQCRAARIARRGADPTVVDSGHRASTDGATARAGGCAARARDRSGAVDGGGRCGDTASIRSIRREIGSAGVGARQTARLGSARVETTGGFDRVGSACVEIIRALGREAAVRTAARSQGAGNAAEGDERDRRLHEAHAQESGRRSARRVSRLLQGPGEEHARRAAARVRSARPEGDRAPSGCGPTPRLGDRRVA